MRIVQHKAVKYYVNTIDRQTNWQTQKRDAILGGRIAYNNKNAKFILHNITIQTNKCMCLYEKTDRQTDRLSKRQAYMCVFKQTVEHKKTNVTKRWLKI